MKGRYAGLPVAAVTVADGSGGTTQVRYWRRRPLPPAGSLATLVVHHVTAQDRLDRIAYAELGEPLAWWMISDANPGLNPETLIDPDASGNILVIPVPEP